MSGIKYATFPFETGNSPGSTNSRTQEVTLAPRVHEATEDSPHVLIPSVSTPGDTSDPTTSTDTSAGPEGILALTPLLYIPCQIRHLRICGLLDSGASENFISGDMVLQLGLRRHKLHVGSSYLAATGKSIICTEFVRVQV